MIEINEKENIDNRSLSLRLEIFNGPMDLLLHLVKEAKIEIRDVFISEVTSQFLEYVKREKDIGRSSEYMEIAATLLEIKSRSLLPTQDSEETESPEEEFIQRLLEYKLLKEAGDKLREIETTGRFYKPPQQMTAKYTAGDLKLDNLLDAFALLMHRLDKHESEVREVVKDSFTVKDKIRYIQDCFMLSNRISFFSLFDGRFNKGEVVVTFSALLELIKLNYISVEQSETFSDIILYKNTSFADNEIPYD